MTTNSMQCTFAGQYSYISGSATDLAASASFGLMFYNARWMDPLLGRFTSPDSIVPTSTQGTQAWDRYAFVNNNPIRYNDPTGHMIDDGCDNGCGESDTATLIELSNKTKGEKMKENYRQRAIIQALKEYQIDVYGASVTYNSGIDGLGDTIDRWTVQIGEGAFSSADFLAANPYHESVHVEQYREGINYPNDMRSEGQQMNEHEAYKKEALWVEENGLSLTEEEMFGITSNRDLFYDELEDINQYLATIGIYAIDPSTVDYPFYPGY